MLIDKTLAGIRALLVASCLAVGCGPKIPETPGDWCDGDICAGDVLHVLRYSAKGGVVYPFSKAVEPDLPPFGIRPEVLIVTVMQPRSDNGELLVPVRRFSKMLKDNCRSEVCENVYGQYGWQFAVASRNCTGTFVSPNLVLTAEHCFISTTWARTYAVLGFYGDYGWPVDVDPADPDEGVMRVPKDRVLKLCHLQACENNRSIYGEFCESGEHGGNCDVALVHVCKAQSDVVQRVSPESLEEPPDVDGQVKDGLRVYSHAWGLPLKRYDVEYDGGVLAHFTNATGGSGALVRDGRGRVVGVVSGRVPADEIVDCPGNDQRCCGQFMTPRQEVLRIINKPELSSCGSLKRFFDHRANGCRECSGAPVSIKWKGK